MTGPNFYTIDFAREVVLQGRTSTFLTVGRNDTSLSTTEEVYMIVFPSTRTFDSYASGSIIPQGAGSGFDTTASISVDITTGFPERLSLNNIAPGMYVKNSQEFMPYADPDNPLFTPPVIGPVRIDSLALSGSGYLSNLSSDPTDLGWTGASAGPPVVSSFTNAHFGYWDETATANSWKLNGKLISEYETIAFTVPPANAQVRDIPPMTLGLQNIFDGSVEDFPSNLLEGTGFVSRSPLGWASIKHDPLLPNASLTFRIDYDGEIDSHLKFNILIFKRNSTSTGVSLTWTLPQRIPESALGPNNPDGTYIGEPYGPKSGKPSAPNPGDISNTIDYQEVHLFGYKQTDVRTSRTTWQNDYVSETKIYDDRASYGVLKTNPKISGNVKITLDSTGGLWLNSIDANNELADSAYKKYPISTSSTYARDLWQFFKKGQTPTSIIFDLFQVDDQYQNTKRTLSEQYDNFYNYGVEQLKNRYYDEGFSFFAPLWLRKTVPDFFVIFRLDHPVSTDSYMNDITNEEFFNNYFKDARIVKTFDMREKSKLGSYLRKIVNDPRYKERPLDVSFDNDIPTTWNGACYQDGTLSGKGEFLYDYWTKDRPVIELEEYITGGFQRHGVISTNLINLEFLFDDTEATPYSINRYFGLYVTENQLANFEIDPYVLGKISNQSPPPKAGVDGEPYSTKEFIQENPDGIQIPVHYYHNPNGTINNTNIPSYQGEVVGKFPLPSLVEDPLRIFYVKDREDAFKRIVEMKEVDYGNPGATDYRRVTQLKLFDNTEDISKYAGVNQITSQLNANLLNKGNSQLRLHISKNDNDKVFADEEEIDITLNLYNHDPRLHTYILKVRSASGSAVTFETFKDQYVEKLNAGFTMPAIGAFVTGLVVDDIKKFALSQQVYITRAGYFTVVERDETLSTIKIQNTGSPTNIAAGNAISSNELISLGGPTYVSTYNATPITNELHIDTLLTLLLVPTPASYSTINSYKIEVRNTEANVINFNTTNTPADIDAKLSPGYQQFRWKLIANEIGLQPGTSWNYPVADPNGYDYITNFSNEGTPSQVALALTNAINSFENRPCNAVAIDDVIYLKASYPGEEGNSLQVSRRMISGESNIHNLGFYEKGNVGVENTITPVTYPSYTPPATTFEFVNNVGKVGTNYTYLKIFKSPSSSYVQIRTDVDPTSLATAAASGSATYYLSTTSTIFTDVSIPFSVDLTNIPNYVFTEYVIEISIGPLVVEQLFIGGNDSNRNRARISYTDSQRYFNDRRVKRTGNIITGSTIISNVSLDNIYVGANVTGTGIPANTYVTKLNYGLNQIEISNTATLDTATDITIGELSILNSTKIRDQWYQTQKGVYNPMYGWDVQGKYVYSLPYLDEPTYDFKNHPLGYTNLGEYSVIELEDSKQQFYQTNDKKIVAYDIYRPIVGIFSIFPIKEFDFDFYFSDYSYTPILEALRYYFNEEISLGETMLLPLDENYKLTPVDSDGAPVNDDYTLEIEGLNPITKEWNSIESINVTGPADQINPDLLLNTYYPLYVYDQNEQPIKWDDAFDTSINSIVYNQNGIGFRNYMRRRSSVLDSNGNVIEAKPLLYRISVSGFTVATTKLKVTKNDYGNDKDLKSFPGFAAITDIYSPEDAEAVRGLLNDSKYVEAFLYQALRSEYDRLRENFNKDYALKSKVVPYISKWVQEGTDARDNYYRLNNSRAFGITNFSPDTNVNFAEPSLLTNEFPYLDTVPKDYPTESLEGSRSYMFAKLDDVAKNGYTWLDLLTGNDDDDWFSKYFSLGYPTEKNELGELVPKSRDERYTFLLYNDGIKRSQTLFRGAKIQVLDINDQLIPPTEITESPKYNDYKFAAIARIIPPTPYINEKPIDIEVYRNDKFKSIVMIINVHVQDYRVQSGLGDYLFLYAVNDQLKNYNQAQVPLNQLQTLIGVEAAHDKLSINDFFPYSLNTQSNYTYLATMRPRQGFLGAGYLELGDTRLGGLAVENQNGYPLEGVLPPNWSGSTLTLYWKSVATDYEFSVLNEIIPTLDNYTDKSTAYSYFSGNPDSLSIVPTSFTQDGSIFKLINALKLSSYAVHVDRSDSKSINDQYLPLQTTFGATDKPEVARALAFGTVVPPFFNISNFGQSQSNAALITGNLQELETFNIKGGTSAYVHIKNLLTYASIRELINSESAFIEYYKVENNDKTAVTDYRLRAIAPDQIIKTGVLSYVNDEDKPIEYIGSPIMGYNLVDTNQNEVVYRHRGAYEPRANDVLSFWVREDESFTKHFGKDYLLFNTHFNNQSPLSGILRNYGINKVADAEVLQIAGGGAYKSVYPLVGEVSIDSKEIFVLNSTWDKNYYRRYNSTTAFADTDGIEEMKEFKSFLGSKVMNIPNTQTLDTFNTTEATYIVTEPAEVVGVKQLSKKEVSFTDVNGNTKPILTIDLDIKTRLLRKLYDDLLLPTSFDEFEWLTGLGIAEFQALNATDIERLKIEYLTKNILQLYQIDEIKLYALSKEGIPIFDVTITDAEKTRAGYRVDKDCKVVNTSEFGIRITKQLDTKKPFGYSVSATIKRI